MLLRGILGVQTIAHIVCSICHSSPSEEEVGYRGLGTTEWAAHVAPLLQLILP